MTGVQVYDDDGANMALVWKGATATASSTVNDGDNTFPIDGKYRTKWPSGCHTDNGPNEWWEVRLPNPTVVTEIVVMNREAHKSACDARLNGARIVLLNAQRVMVPVPAMVLSGDNEQNFMVPDAEAAPEPVVEAAATPVDQEVVDLPQERESAAVASSQHEPHSMPKVDDVAVLDQAQDALQRENAEVRPQEESTPTALPPQAFSVNTSSADRCAAIRFLVNTH